MIRKLTNNKIKKIVLAYSGGLDTSVILKWLQETYQCEVVTFTADLGQGEELSPAKARAKLLGVKQIFVEDLREEFVKNYVAPMMRANALYEGRYLLGTAIARPLIAKKQIEIAEQTAADAVAHGATGKGNDQLRFELGYYALKPEIKVIAPWREWSLQGRKDLIDYAKQHQIPITKSNSSEQELTEEPPFSQDANLLHISSEGKILEDPNQPPTQEVYSRTVNISMASDKGEELVIDFRQGDPIALNEKSMTYANLLQELNVLAGRNAIGRLDLVENRFVGMKSRGIYETPGGTVWQWAHREIESLCLDREAAHLKDELMPRYAHLIYYGFWFAPERYMLQALIDESQKEVEGQVRLQLIKGNIITLGRVSKKSLYALGEVSFEAGGNFNQRDAEGFIALQALRLKLLAGRSLKAD